MNDFASADVSRAYRQKYSFVIEDARDDSSLLGVKAFANASAMQRKKMVHDAIKKVRTAQIKDVGYELSKLGVQDADARINKSIEQFPITKPTHSFKDDAVERRREFKAAVRSLVQSSDEQYATLSGSNVLFAVAHSVDNIDAYTKSTARYTTALTQLFDNIPYDDGMDMGFFCTDHKQIRILDADVYYKSFNYHAGRFGVFGVSMAAPTWGYGDAIDRRVFGRVVRILENVLLANQNFDWSRVQQEYASVLRKVDDGNTRSTLSGDVIMERHDGKLAAKFVQLLWHVFNDKDHKRDNLFPFPKYGATASNTFAGEFKANADLEDEYVHRLVYTALRTSWFLHTPCAPALIMALFEASNATTFEMLEKDMDKYAEAIVYHRFIGCDLANGTMDRFGARVLDKIHKQSTETTLTNAPINADADDYPFYDLDYPYDNNPANDPPHPPPPNPNWHRSVDYYAEWWKNSPIFKIAATITATGVMLSAIGNNVENFWYFVGFLRLVAYKYRWGYRTLNDAAAARRAELQVWKYLPANLADIVVGGKQLVIGMKDFGIWGMEEAGILERTPWYYWYVGAFLMFGTASLTLTALVDLLEDYSGITAIQYQSLLYGPVRDIERLGRMMLFLYQSYLRNRIKNMLRQTGFIDAALMRHSDAFLSVGR